MSQEFMKQVVRGVHRWDYFEPADDHRTIEKVRSELTSLAAVASPEPLFVSGAVPNDDKTSVSMAAVSRHVTVSASFSSQVGNRVSVHSNSSLKRIDIESTNVTTSNVMGLSAGGPLEFHLVFDWGSVQVHRWTGEDAERAAWLKHFTGLLGSRAGMTVPG